MLARKATTKMSHGKSNPFDRPITSPIISNAMTLEESWVTLADRFFFAPAALDTLCLMRLITGFLIFYITFCYSFELLAFVGPDGFINLPLATELRKESPIYVMAPNWNDPTYEVEGSKESLNWSVFFHATSIFWVWAFHIGFMIANLFMALGLFSKTSSILSWLGALSYVHRAPSALFGMDSMIVILLFYMMLAPCGELYSLDHYFCKLRRKKKGDPNWNEPPQPLILANFVTRLVQIHFCIIYFASATSKLQGPSWWNGTALWGVLANYSFNPMHIQAYTSFLTFLAKHKVLWEASMTLGCIFTILVETCFPFLVWLPRLKWIMISSSILLHTGIGLLMGLTAFSLCMMTLVLAFVPPEFIKELIHRYILQKFNSAKP